MNIEKSFCTTSEAAQLLGVSVGTVQLWVESGLLAAWKTAGGHRRVMRESVEKLLRKPTPGEAANSGPAPLADAAASASRPLSVLVVEDDSALLRLYDARISAWPMRPNMVAIDSAFAALVAIGRAPPDLLITDLHMSGMDGFEMLKVIATEPDLADTTIVVVSGLDKGTIRDHGGVPQGIEILPKPVPFDRLLTIATGIVNKKNLRTA